MTSPSEADLPADAHTAASDWTCESWRTQFDSDIEAYLAHPVTLEQVAGAVAELPGVNQVEIVHGWVVLDLGGGEAVGVLEGDVHVGGWCLAVGRRSGSELGQVSWPALLSHGRAAPALIAERVAEHLEEMRQVIQLAPAVFGISWPQLLEEIAGSEPVTTGAGPGAVLSQLRMLASDPAP